MNQLQIFENGEFGQLPVIIVDGVEWFGATEAATALSFSKPHDAIKNHVEEDDSAFHGVIDSMGRKQKKKFINESGLYSLIFGAAKQGNNPEIQARAKVFKRWVTKDVLPSIRKSGAYVAEINTQAPSLELQIKQQRVEAMAINAKTNRHKTVMKSLQDMNLSSIAFQVAGLTALEELVGKKIDYRPEVEKMYTATQIGLEVGVSKNGVGKIANANGLKTNEYGKMVLDKSPYSSKEVPSFRYNERGRQRLLELLNRKEVETCQLSN